MSLVALNERGGTGRGASAFVPFALLLAVALTTFAPVLFFGRTLYPTDITNRLFLPFASGPGTPHVQATSLLDYVLHYYPARVFQATSLRAGSLGLWNPYTYGGHPAFASNGSTQLLDPFNIVLLVFPDVGTALAWRSFLQVLACLVFTYLYLRQLPLGVAPSLLGAVGFGLNSMFWVNVFDWSLAGMLWVPLICLALDRALATGRMRPAVAAGLGLGVALVASPLQVAVYVLLAVTGVTVFRWFVGVPLPLLRARGALLCLALLLGVALAAVQLVPTAELLAHSTRLQGGVVDASARTLRTPRQMVLATAGLVAFVFPNLIGRVKDSMMVSGGLWGGETHWQGFIGVLPFALALVAGLAARDRRRLAYGWLAVAVVGVVVYTPLALLLYERCFVVYVFAAAVLAGIGAEAVANRDVDPRHVRTALRLLAGLAGAVAVGLVAIDMLLTFRGQAVEDVVARAILLTLPSNYLGSCYPQLYLAKGTRFLADLRGLQAWLPLVLLVAGLLLVLLRLRGRISARWFLRIAVAATVCDMIVMTWTHVPLVDRRVDPFAPSSPAVEALRASDGPYRVLSIRVPGHPPVLPVGTSAVYGLQSLAGYDNMHPLNPFDLVRTRFSSCGAETCIALTGTGLANVRFVMTDNRALLPGKRFDRIYDREVRVYRDRAALPRVYRTVSWSVVPDAQAALAAAASTARVESGTHVLLDREPGIPAQRTAGGHAGTASITDYRDTSVTIRVEGETDGVVVLSDTFYPGWRATVDGRPAPVLRANGVMRAVPVRAGRHVLQFSFSPRSLEMGAGISLLALLLAGVLFVMARRPSAPSVLSGAHAR